MSSLITMFGDIDDFCKSFEPLYLPQRLRDEQDHMTLLLDSRVVECQDVVY